MSSHDGSGQLWYIASLRAFAWSSPGEVMNSGTVMLWRLIASLFMCVVTSNAFAADLTPRILKKTDPIQLEGGEWHHELRVDDTPIPCSRMESSRLACVAYAVEVFNTSLQPLDCMVNLWVPGYANPSKRGPMRVNWRSQSVVLRSTHEREEIPRYDLSCTPQPKIDTSELTIDCKMNLDKTPLQSVEYPPASRRAGETGLVYLHFSLSKTEGPPTDIVVTVPTFPRLDEAAVNAVSRLRGSTDCEKGRFELSLGFDLY